MLNHNVAKKIMKSSIKTFNDLIRYWYVNETFREILENLDASSDIWFDIYKIGIKINFVPLAYAIVYLYDHDLIEREYIVETEIKNRIRYNSKSQSYHNEIPIILINNIRFTKLELSDMLRECVNVEQNYDVATLLIKKGADYYNDYGEILGNALMRAISDNQIDFFKTILEKGYKLNIADAQAIIDCYAQGYSNIDISLEFLRIMMVDYKLDISELNLIHLFGDKVNNGFSRFLNFARDLNNPINLSFIRNGMTVLDNVCWWHRINALKTLLDYGIDINDPKLSVLGPIHATVMSARCMPGNMRGMIYALQEADAKNTHDDDIALAIKNFEDGNRYHKT